MNEKVIWDYLYNKLRNVYGTAALMGNLMAESSLNPKCANGVSKLGLTNETYTKMVDEDQPNNFINDGIAYGLAQWCYKTRKQGLWEMAKKTKKSIGDISLQLDYLWDEIQKYKTVIKALYDATNVKEASDIVMLKYERPGNTSDTAKQKRAKYGEQYLSKYGQKYIEFSIKQKTAINLFDQLQKHID